MLYSLEWYDHFPSLYRIQCLLSIINPLSTGSVFRRQIVTFKDRPRTESITIFMVDLTHNIGIQMNQKGLTKSYMVTSN